MTAIAPQRGRRALELAVLIFAGEAIFGLPFHVARFFRPTLLTGLGLDNSELGALFSVYGVVAMLCYLPGGLLADRFTARALMTVSLAATGLAGLGLAALPELPTLLAIYALLGVTTILLFWAALIRATREWGDPSRQGAAFGLLDGGRGLCAAVLASLAYVPYSLAFTDLADPADQRLAALRGVFWVYTAATLLAAALVWLVTPDRDVGPRREPIVLRRALLGRTIWLQGLIVLCAYCAFKGIDNYALFAVQVHGLGEVEGAGVSVLSAWVRPFAALGAGLLADRIRPTRVVQLAFVALVLGYLGFMLDEPRPGSVKILWLDILVTCAAAFALRGVYPALMEEVRVPPAITGTAVGFISLVGFLPDVFLGPLTGWLLDRSPGAAGHLHVFTLLAAIAGLGLLASTGLRRCAP